MVHVWGNDRETLTYDDAGGAYWGWATVSGTTVRLSAPPLMSGSSHGRELVMILNGTGAHEYRRVVVPGGASDNDNRTWTIDRPFSAAVTPNDKIFIQIMPARAKNLHVRNKLADGGAIQIYGHGTDIVIAENVAERMTGFAAWGQWRGRPGNSSSSKLGGAFGVGMNPTTHLQMLSNYVKEGNNIVNIWYTNTSDTTGDYNPGPWLHGTGVANFWDQYCFAVVDGRVGFLTPADNPYGQFSNAFVILRSNRVDSNGGVWVTGTARDVLVENTAIAQSDHNITIDKSTTAVLVVQ